MNRAGEVLYRNILGRTGARFSVALTGKNGLCSRADSDALELNAGRGGELSSLEGDDGEVDNVMVAIEVPLD